MQTDSHRLRAVCHFYAVAAENAVKTFPISVHGRAEAGNQ